MMEDYSLGESDDFSLGESDIYSFGESFNKEITSNTKNQNIDKIDIEKFYKDFVSAFVKSKYQDNEYEDFIFQGKIKAKSIYDFFRLKPFQKPTDSEKEKIIEICNKLSSEAEVYTRTDVDKRNILVNCIGILKSFFTTGKNTIINERLQELSWNSLDLTIDEKCEDGIVSMSEIISLLKAGVKLGLVYDSESKKAFFIELKNKIDERDAKIEPFEEAFKNWFEEYAANNPDAYSTTLKNQLIIARTYKELEVLTGKEIKTSDKEYVIHFEENLAKLGIKLGEGKEEIKQEKKEEKTVEQEVKEVIVEKEIITETVVEKPKEVEPVVVEQKIEEHVVKESPVVKENLNINLTPDMIYIEGGTFVMGSDEGERNEKPVHEASINDFYMSNHLVTQEEYSKIMGNNPSYFKGNQKPVEAISWYNAIEYCNKRSILEGLTPCYNLNGKTNVDLWGTKLVDWDNVVCDIAVNGYRLPTEIEWEYAAKGGKHFNENHFLYSGSNDINSVAYYYVNSGNETHDVMLLQKNELGIYDLSGNVWEWCWDWFYKYSDSYQINPIRKMTDFFRIRRGGGWNDLSTGCRVTTRDYAAPNNMNNNLGFRVVRSQLS